MRCARAAISVSHFEFAAVSRGDLKHTATQKVMIVPHMIHHGNSRTGIQSGRGKPEPPNMEATPLSRPLSHATLSGTVTADYDAQDRMLRYGDYN